MVNTVGDRQLLKSLLFDWKTNPSTAYTGSKAHILNAAKKRGYSKGLTGLNEFLLAQDEYTLTYPSRKKYPLNYYPCFRVGQLFECDLISLGDIKQYNSGYSWILVCVDCLTRAVWLRHLKTKGSKEVRDALADIFKTSKIEPRYLRTDAGREFLNRDVTALLNRLGIAHRVAGNVHGAALAENAVRRVMKRLTRYFIHCNTYNYEGLLPYVAEALNSTPMRSLNGCSPNDVMKNSGQRLMGYDIWYKRVKAAEKRFYFESGRHRDVTQLLKRQKDFKKGDYVRVSIEAHPFRKGYAKNFSTEYFRVHQIIKNQPIWMFTVSDLNNAVIEGNFYPSELLKVGEPSRDQLYEIEKVLTSRLNKKTRKKEYLVRFKGYDSSFDQYVNEKDIVQI